MTDDLDDAGEFTGGMSDTELKAILDERIGSAIGYRFGSKDQLSEHRRDSLKMYHGEKFGNEMDGRSQVVSRDVAESIDSMLPSLIKIFASGDQIVNFEPTGPEDEAAAKQETDYVNWAYQQQSNGFRFLYSWFKAALMFRLGVAKIWWDTKRETSLEKYEGLDDQSIALLLMDPNLEEVSREPEVADEQPVDPAIPGVPPLMSAQPAPGPMTPPTYTVTVRRTNKTGKICIANVAEEEILIDPYAVDDDELKFIAHQCKQTVSDLVEMGFPRAKVVNLSGDTDTDYSPERRERFKDESSLPDSETSDKSMREINVIEAYLRVDYDGDGKAEFRKIVYAGNEILSNEEVDGHPFATLTPIIMPHKLIGMSVADQTMDLQLIKSTIWRQALDNMYLNNAPQLTVIENQVNLDDVLTRRPGGVIRMKAAGAVSPLVVQPLDGSVFHMIEYMDTQREQRTGVTRYNQGLDANTLNKTAAGINMIQNAAQERLELIARVFAETGVKRMFRLISELTRKHVRKAQQIRLRGTWVEVDPADWKNKYDMTVSVGLGTGNRNQQLATFHQLLMIDQELVKLQGGANGPLVTMKNIYNKLVKTCEAAGLKSPEMFYTDPATVPPQPQQPNPKIVEAQAKMQIEGQKAQQQMAIAGQKARHEMALDEAQMQHEARLKDQELQSKMVIDRGNAQTDAHLRLMQSMKPVPPVTPV